MRVLSQATAKLFAPVPMRPTDRLRLSMTDHNRQFKACVYSTTGQFASLGARSQWLGRVPERKELSGEVGPSNSQTWQIAATDYTVEIIRAVWPTDQVEFIDEAAIVFNHVALVSAQQDLNAAQLAAFKELNQMPGELNGAINHELPLALYQHAAAYISVNTPGYGLFMEQGTGKTPTVVARICAEAPGVRATKKRMYRALIVCPKSVRVNWQREITRFTTLPCKIEALKGGRLMRIGTLVEAIHDEDDCVFTVVICSYEGMVKTKEALCALEWDLVVLDESHYIKSPSTTRTKTAWKLRDVARQRMCLTGTPVCNSPLDLYAQFEFMGEGWSGFKSWEGFRSFYGVFEKPEGESYQKLVAIQNQPFMQERLARLSFMVSKKEALPHLPEKTHDVFEVEMSAQQQEVYKKVAEELLYEIESDMENPDALTVNNILVKLLRLAQICSGYVVWDRTPEELQAVLDGAKIGRRLEWFAENPKLDALVELLKEKSTNQKTLVWCCFVPDIKVIADRLAKEGIKAVTFFGGTRDDARDSIVDAFNNDPSVKVLIGNPAAGGVGLNLVGYPYQEGEECEHTTNCDHEIFYSQDWSMAKRSQAEDRPHRRGTRTSVRVTDLMIPETIDEEIRLRVLNKKLSALQIGDVREILQNLLHGVKATPDDEPDVSEPEDVE